MKLKGNELVRARKHKHALARYSRLAQLLEASRDFDSDEEVEAVRLLLLATCNNLALVCSSLADWSAAVRWAGKALEVEPGNAKALFR